MTEPEIPAPLSAVPPPVSGGTPGVLSPEDVLSIRAAINESNLYQENRERKRKMRLLVRPEPVKISPAEAAAGGLAGGVLMRPYEQVAPGFHGGAPVTFPDSSQTALQIGESVGLLAPSAALAAGGEAVAGPGGFLAGGAAPGAILAAQRGGLPAAEVAAGSGMLALAGMRAGGPVLRAVTGAGTAAEAPLVEALGATAGGFVPYAAEGRKPNLQEAIFGALPLAHGLAFKALRSVGADAPEIRVPEERVNDIVADIETWQRAQPPEPVQEVQAAPDEVPPPLAANPEAGSASVGAATLGVAPLLEHTVAPAIRTFAEGLHETGSDALKLLAPAALLEPSSLDAIHGMLGDRYRVEFQLSHLFDQARKGVETMPEAERIDFVDRYKAGQTQKSPELDALSSAIRKIDKASWDAAQAEGIPLAWKDNHFRVFWKVIPGSTRIGQMFPSLSRRQLQGTRGMLKRSTLATMSEGIQKGGAPTTTNFVNLFQMAQADLWKLITARRMWNWAKYAGLVKFRRPGAEMPDGFGPVNDSIARIYFRAESGEGLIKAGEYIADENFGRVLNNMLAVDHIRATALGRGLLWAKNQYTAAELGLSGFHAIFETGEATGSQMGVAARRMWNLGVLQKNPGAFKDSLGDLLRTPGAAAGIAKEGGDLIRYAGNAQEFLATSRGKDFLARLPGADQLVKSMWASGVKLEMHADYKLKSIQAFNDAKAAGDPLGALFHSPFAANQAVMRPLFEVYIPRLKLGMWAREFELARQEHSAELSSGQMTDAQLGREVWRFVENRFGEMNFDTLFWKPTFKTALQLAFRSVTWKLGNLLSFGAVVPRQLFEFARAAKDNRVPRLMPEAAWLMGMSGLTAAFGTVASKALSGRYPWQWPGDVTYNTVFPHVDPQDPDVRITTPTYWKDLLSFKKSPSGYLTSGMSGLMGKTIQLWQNKDFYGTEVYDPDGSIKERAGQVLMHYIPEPFSIASFLKMREQGEPLAQQVAGFAGFTRAPGYISRTPAQQKAAEISHNKGPRVTSLEDAAQNKRRAVLTSRIMKGLATPEEISLAINDLGLSRTQVKNIVKSAHTVPLLKMIQGMRVKDALKVWELADPEERKQIAPQLRLSLFHELQAHGNHDSILERARQAGLFEDSSQAVAQ